MKKLSCLMIAVLLLMILFSGCMKKDEFSVKICGYSDSIPENPHKLEYKDWSQEAFVDSKAEKNVAFSVGDFEVSGNYVRTEKRFSEFYETHEYKDENNCYFMLTDDGKLSSYFFGSSSSDQENQQIYTESECIDIASAFISNITDISQYTVTASLDEERRIYTVSFVKYADGFQCSDRADIRIEETGHIYSFSSTMLGRIPTEAESGFDLEAVQNQVTSKLDAEYAKAKRAYDSVSYGNFNYELTIDGDGEYALICWVDVHCIHSYNDGDAIFSERILFLIQKN